MLAISTPQEESNQYSPTRPKEGDSLAAGYFKEIIPFGKYLLLDKIAQGRRSEVYCARAVSGVPPDLLAIKCMCSSLARDNRFVEMFIREGKLAIMLDHPNIIRTYDVGSIDGRYFISMEYILGKDLDHLLKRCHETGQSIPIPHALFIALQTCQALQYAHDLNNPPGRLLNIVNRNVSPSNIRISYDGCVKLLDFGIAQAIIQVSGEIGTLTGQFSYMSPEQIRGLPLDRRTDIFSLGIVLHEMLSGELLFRDDSEFVLMEMVRRAEVKPPSFFNPRVAPELDNIVMKALERDVGTRYSNADAMTSDLSHLLSSYQFSPAELGEFVQSLFPSNYEKQKSLQRCCLSRDKLLIPSSEGLTDPRKTNTAKNTALSSNQKGFSFLTPSQKFLGIAFAMIILAIALIIFLIVLW